MGDFVSLKSLKSLKSFDSRRNESLRVLLVLGFSFEGLLCAVERAY